MSQVGINVFEDETPAGVLVRGAQASVTGILGITERGIPHVPVRVTSAESFRRYFGYYRQDANTAHALDLYFANGGTQCVVTRIVGAGSSPASATLADRQAAPAPALIVAGGQRGVADPGPWGTNVRIDLRDDPRLTTTLSADAGAAATSLQLTSVDGIAPGSVLRISDPGQTFFRRLETVDAATGTVTFTDATPGALSAADTVLQSAEFRLVVRHRPFATAEFAPVEEWRNLSMQADSPDYALARVNHEFQGSRFIVLTDASLATAPVGEKNPQVVSNSPLLGGSEGAITAASYIGDAAQRTGIHAFHNEVPPLIITPDVHALAAADVSLVVRALLDYAEQNAAFYIAALPDRAAAVPVPRRIDDYTQNVSDYVAAITDFIQPFHAPKAFGAWYGPHGSIFDPVASGTTKVRFVPLDAAVAGLFAKVEGTRGIHKAPAGVTARIAGVNTVSAEVTEAQNTHVARIARANLVRRSSRGGVAVSTSRTASSDSRWFFVSTRRLFNFVMRSLKIGLRPFVHEVHDAALRQRVKDTASTFLAGLHRNGAFGQGSPDETYRVKCDLENNSAEEIRLGRLNVDVSFYPSRPAEEINISVGLDSNGVLANES